MRSPAVPCLQRMIRDIGSSISKLVSELLSVVRLSSIVLGAGDNENRLACKFWKRKFVGNSLRSYQYGTDEQAGATAI